MVFCFQYSNEEIVTRFNNKNRPSLKGKPKWFIFQSCRGESLDQGTSANGRNGHQIDASVIENSERSDTVPTWEDILILYATIPSYVAYRNTMEGSILIHYLDKVFRELAQYLDIKELLDRVSDKIKRYESGSGGKQMCSYEVRGFCYKLYFKPRFLHSTPSSGRISRRNVGTDAPSEQQLL